MQDQNDGELERTPTTDGSSTVSRTSSPVDHVAPIDVDDLFEALSNSRRRHVIRLVGDDEVDVGELARTIAAVENEIALESIDSQQRKRVYVALHQVHLPKLDDYGIVEWNDRAQTITTGPAHETALEAMAAATGSVDEPDSILDRVRNFIRGGV